MSLLGVTILTVGCGDKGGPLDELFKEPDVTPVKNVLKTALPLSYAANLAMAALSGNVLPNVIMVQSGDTAATGCFIMQIAVDNSFPLPAGLAANGTIMVAGLKAQTEAAVMSAFFTDLNITQGSFTVRDVSTFIVDNHTDVLSGEKSLMVVYADVDINAGSDTLVTVKMSDSAIQSEWTRYTTMLSFDSTVALDENAWIIRIENQGTVGNAADDQYIISGGGQYIEAGSNGAGLLQITMVNMTMAVSCCKNPVAGWALIQNLDATKNNSGAFPELGHVLLTTHATCDGTLEITAATGVYTKSWGDRTALNLGN